MNNYKQPLTGNPLTTKSDLQRAVDQICHPLKKYFIKDFTLINLHHSDLIYTRGDMFQTFARPLWGIVPLLAGGGETELWQNYFEGIKNGTDPNHPEYWGIGLATTEYPVLGCSLAMIPEKVWEPLDRQHKDNLAQWLYHINNLHLWDNNFLFFRILTNTGLLKVGQKYDADSLERDLKRIDDFYLSEGWYSDGPTSQRDYYISFAMHYYGLIYAALMEKEDPERSGRYKERARLFARDFIYWFSEDGSAIPFGRSLTYKFAQSAFWGALAFAGVEAFPWGVVKGILLRNLRWWFKQPVFDNEGILGMGYAYINQFTTEAYNAPGTSYWAMKSFLPLALDEEHPFWQAEELPLPELEPVKVQKHPWMLVCRPENESHVFALTSGQHGDYAANNDAAKYAKFAYSNTFGFSVPRGTRGLAQGGYDSVLALSEGDDYYKVRHKCEEVEILDRAIYSRWKSWKDVEVETWLVPALPWHVRIHLINTERYLEAAEGGFSIEAFKGESKPAEGWSRTGPDMAAAVMPWGYSGIINLLGHEKGQVIRAQGQTNLMLPYTVIPFLITGLKPGRHWLISAIAAGRESSFDKVWEDKPVLEVIQNKIKIFHKDVCLLELDLSLPGSVNGV